jgi:hypothetical protein
VVVMAAEIKFDLVDEAVTCAMNGCNNDSSAWVTSGALDLVATPFCSVCAALKFSQWMVETHVAPEGMR